MRTLLVDEKPPLDELAHFGVLGMKWGHRKAATGTEIKDARSRLKVQSSAYRQQSKKLDTTTGARKKALENRLRKSQQAYLNNPDRIIAARMTRGEKLVSLVLGSAEAGVGIGAAAAGIAGTSAVSRRIEFKQDNGGYKVKKNAKVQKRIGYDQLARPLIQAGAAAAPSILTIVGSSTAASIGARAATNRAAAKAAPKNAIGSAAAKLKFAKAGRGGAFKITTMK